ncbi:DUF4307 domain-containing protein [Actinotalea sp. M2MS4P-6]|uniref:DUF4307 domain-containing protein n=1 Tax=Actinotalea sp. M2MS4P-6 TaxID=2983762 RepID=UPI0021E4B0D1|nr:DUF4307 domain-containing protein [Actinotalea sp. M2MS4P-6]MCV2396382.1 DUF4307 domain-containing protein [Actinotalea sp. M2MS4P-6]
MTAPTVPEGRYGRPATPGRRRRAVLGVAALAVAGLAVLGWVISNTANPAVSWRDVGFEVDGSRAVTVTFDVMRADPSVPVQCRVQALNIHYAQVGVVTVDVEPGELSAQRERVEIATTEEAVTGVVHSCWVTQE